MLYTCSHCKKDILSNAIVMEPLAFCDFICQSAYVEAEGVPNPAEFLYRFVTDTYPPDEIDHESFMKLLEWSETPVTPEDPEAP